MMVTYRAVTWREEGFWVVDVPDLDVATQARRLDQVETMTRSLVAIHLDVPSDSFDVEVEPRLPREVADEIDHARRLRNEARVKAEEAAALWARSAAHLYEAGMPYRDVGQVLGVSFQRAKQLVDEASEAPAVEVRPQRTRRGHATHERRREQDKVDA